MRYVAHIAGMYLLVCVSNGGILFCWVLQLENTERYAVYIEQHIGYANIIFIAVSYFELVNGAESILFGFIEID